MAVHLHWSATSEISVSHQVWCAALEVAQMYGWQPQGTHPTKGVDVLSLDAWDGNYVTGEEQRVTAVDARYLAAALRSALDDLPDHDAMEYKTQTFRLPDGEVRVITTADYSPFELLSGPNKLLLEELIARCEQGAFEIGAQAFSIG